MTPEQHVEQLREPPLSHLSNQEIQDIVCATVHRLVTVADGNDDRLNAVEPDKRAKWAQMRLRSVQRLTEALAERAAQPPASSAEEDSDKDWPDEARAEYLARLPSIDTRTLSKEMWCLRPGENLHDWRPQAVLAEVHGRALGEFKLPQFLRPGRDKTEKRDTWKLGVALEEYAQNEAARLDEQDPGWRWHRAIMRDELHGRALREFAKVKQAHRLYNMTAKVVKGLGGHALGEDLRLMADFPVYREPGWQWSRAVQLNELHRRAELEFARVQHEHKDYETTRDSVAAHTSVELTVFAIERKDRQRVGPGARWARALALDVLHSRALVEYAVDSM